MLWRSRSSSRTPRTPWSSTKLPNKPSSVRLTWTTVPSMATTFLWPTQRLAWTLILQLWRREKRLSLWEILLLLLSIVTSFQEARTTATLCHHQRSCTWATCAMIRKTTSMLNCLEILALSESLHFWKDQKEWHWWSWVLLMKQWRFCQTSTTLTLMENIWKSASQNTKRSKTCNYSEQRKKKWRNKKKFLASKNKKKILFFQSWITN